MVLRNRENISDINYTILFARLALLMRRLFINYEEIAWFCYVSPILGWRKFSLYENLRIGP